MKRIHNDESVSSLFKIDNNGSNQDSNMAKQVKLTAERRDGHRAFGAVRKTQGVIRGVPAALLHGAKDKAEPPRSPGAISTPC